MANKLTGKQAAFVEYYLTNFNATDAARRAGYSEKTAKSIGSENLTKPDIQNALAQRIAENKATADEVVLRLASHSRGTMDDFIGPLDRLDLERARERGVMHLIKKWKETTTTSEDFETHRVEIELHDAQAATVQLAKILGQYVERSVTMTWREYLESRGISASETFERLIAAARHAAISVRSDDDGRDGGDDSAGGDPAS